MVFAYSDVSHEYVMNRASLAMACGADFRLLGPEEHHAQGARCPWWPSRAVRTGAGKSQTTRRVAEILTGRGLKVVVVRHPMPYGNLDEQVVQRFADPRRSGAAPLHHRGAGRVRTPHRPGQRGLRGRRLRQDPGAGPGRSRRHPVGRRQQRLLRSTGPTCSSPSPTRTGPGHETVVPSGRDQLPHGRCGRHQQGGLGASPEHVEAVRDAVRSRQPHGAVIIEAASPDHGGRPGRCPGQAGRRGGGRSHAHPRRHGLRRGLIAAQQLRRDPGGPPARTRWARSKACLPALQPLWPTCCPPWATARRRCGSLRRPSTRRPPTWWSSARPSTWAGSLTLNKPAVRVRYDSRSRESQPRVDLGRAHHLQTYQVVCRKGFSQDALGQSRLSTAPHVESLHSAGHCHHSSAVGRMHSWRTSPGSWPSPNTDTPPLSPNRNTVLSFDREGRLYAYF